MRRSKLGALRGAHSKYICTKATTGHAPHGAVRELLPPPAVGVLLCIATEPHKSSLGIEPDNSRRRSNSEDEDSPPGLFPHSGGPAPCPRDASRCHGGCEPGFKARFVRLECRGGKESSRPTRDSKHPILVACPSPRGLMLTKMGSKHLEWDDDVRGGRLA